MGEDNKKYCSVVGHETEDAAYESTHSPGWYYCTKCATYVMMEWGIGRLKKVNGG